MNDSLMLTLRLPHSFTIVSLAVLCSLTCMGCNSTTTEGETDAHTHGHEHGHEHASRPESLHKTVEQLAEIQQEIGSAIEAGDTEAAHGPLHEVAELLEAVPDIAAETELPKEQWKAVKAASDRLFAAYAVIDKAFHTEDGDKQAAYEQVADELSEALEEIRSRLPLAGEEAKAEATKDETDHDHDEHRAEEQPSTPQTGATP